MISFVIAISCLLLAFAVYLARYVIQHDVGTEKMQEISNAIKEGAEAFLSRQNRTIISLSAVLAALIFFLYAFVRTPSPADPAPPLEMAFGSRRTVRPIGGFRARSAKDSLHHCRLRIWRVLRRAFCAARRRYLHEGCRRWR